MSSNKTRVQTFIQNLKQREDTVPISPEAAFEEFVRDHGELLRKLAL
jgi:hypothetical protein